MLAFIHQCSSLLRMIVLIVVAGSMAAPLAASACSIRGEGNSVESAYQSANTVIHARIVEEQKRPEGGARAKLEIIRVLKGGFSGASISTGGHNLCGLGGFEVGREYVFFFDANDTHVDIRRQPNGLPTAAEVLSKISKFLNEKSAYKKSN